jgi:hypothetical protein
VKREKERRRSWSGDDDDGGERKVGKKRKKKKLSIGLHTRNRELDMLMVKSLTYSND